MPLMIRAAVQQPLESTRGFCVSSLGKELEGNLLPFQARQSIPLQK